MALVLMTLNQTFAGGDESDFSEREDNDEVFTRRKNKVKEIKKKAVKVKPSVEKKRKSKCNSFK